MANTNQSKLTLNIITEGAYGVIVNEDLKKEAPRSFFNMTVSPIESLERIYGKRYQLIYKDCTKCLESNNQLLHPYAFWLFVQTHNKYAIQSMLVQHAETFDSSLINKIVDYWYEYHDFNFTPLYTLTGYFGERMIKRATHQNSEALLHSAEVLSDEVKQKGFSNPYQRSSVISAFISKADMFINAMFHVKAANITKTLKDAIFVDKYKAIEDTDFNVFRYRLLAAHLNYTGIEGFKSEDFLHFNPNALLDLMKEVIYPSSFVYKDTDEIIFAYNFIQNHIKATKKRFKEQRLLTAHYLEYKRCLEYMNASTLKKSFLVTKAFADAYMELYSAFEGNKSKLNKLFPSVFVPFRQDKKSILKTFMLHTDDELIKDLIIMFDASNDKGTVNVIREILKEKK